MKHNIWWTFRYLGDYSAVSWITRSIALPAAASMVLRGPIPSAVYQASLDLPILFGGLARTYTPSSALFITCSLQRSQTPA